MAAPKGNKFWKARTKHGANGKFTNEQLWNACLEYFDWVEDNPLYESKLVSYKGVSVLEDVPKMRAMTVNGLCLFLGIAPKTWYEWKKDKDNKDLCNIIEYVETTIREQKLAGAAADLLNPNIIAREIGLAEKHETTVIAPQIIDDIPDIPDVPLPEKE